MANYDSGIRIALTNETYRIIENDIELFRNNRSKRSKKQGESQPIKYQYKLNAFLNKIFVSMCDGKSIKLNQKRNTKHTTKSFPIKLNSEIIELMRSAKIDLEESAIRTPVTDMSRYYSHFIEEYAKLSQKEREKVFYKDWITQINDCKNNRRLIHVQWWKKNISEALLLPYDVFFSEDVNHYYLVAFSLAKKESEYHYINTLNIPLRRIILFEKSYEYIFNPDISIIFKQKNDISGYSDLIKLTETRISDGELLYISDVRQKVEIQLTEKGLENIRSRGLFIPQNIEISQINDNTYIISFEATWLQTFLYFFKFGQDAVILSPKKYRDRFIESYNNALQEYKKTEDLAIMKTEE